MTTEEYLSQLCNIDRRIKNKVEEAKRWYDIAESTGSREMTADRVQTSHKPDKMGEATICAVDCMKEAEAIANDYTIKKRRIIREIDGIKNELHYNILIGHYLNGMNFSELGLQEHYSTKQIKKHMDKAKAEFEELYGERYL